MRTIQLLHSSSIRGASQNESYQNFGMMSPDLPKAAGACSVMSFIRRRTNAPTLQAPSREESNNNYNVDCTVNNSCKLYQRKVQILSLQNMQIL